MTRAGGGGVSPEIREDIRSDTTSVRVHQKQSLVSNEKCRAALKPRATQLSFILLLVSLVDEASTFAN